MMSVLLRSAAAAMLVVLSCRAAPAQTPPAVDTIPAPRILEPKGQPTAMIVLLSDAAGWTRAEDAMAASLVGGGAAVIGIDLPAYLRRLDEDDGDCIYTLSDIERLSQTIQRSAGGGMYHLPILAGIGAGGAMALAIAAQTPAATVSQTIAVDPAAGIALRKPLCTPAKKTRDGALAVYGLTDGALPAPIRVDWTSAASDAGRAHVEALLAAHPDIVVEETDDEATATLLAAVADAVATPRSDALGLPVTVLDAVPTRDTMAIVYSGDGGWRDLDKEIGETFQKDGVPTVGVDSLRYFWSEKTPQETADDLKRMIDLYSKQWGVRNVLLVGFSFGADILPSTYNLLAPAEQSRVKEISLLALSKAATFQVSVSGWLGVGDDGNDRNVAEVARIDPRRVQCLYGTEDEDAVCDAFKGTGVELVAVVGGHHFDGDYEALAHRILVGLDTRRTAADAGGAAAETP